jgi:hypothetical protein
LLGLKRARDLCRHTSGRTGQDQFGDVPIRAYRLEVEVCAIASRSRPWRLERRPFAIEVNGEDKLANDGHDTRAIQAYLGHRNIQNTTRYTALAPQWFK